MKRFSRKPKKSTPTPRKWFNPFDPFDGALNVEPVKRWVGGRFGWAIHRFPVKNGRSYEETVMADWWCKMAENISTNNALFRRLLKKN